MIKFWTATYRYSGPYRLDITVSGKEKNLDPLGAHFAPTWKMVKDHKEGKITDEQYIALYKEILSKIPPEIWAELYKRKQFVAVCFCRSDKFCHRFVFASELIKQGLTYKGEINLIAVPKKKIIGPFKGEYEFLRNPYPAPFWYQGILYPSIEHFYQGWKGTVEDRKRIAAIPEWWIAKKEGRKLKLPWNWKAINVEVMLTGNREKYKAHPELAEKLIATYPHKIIEFNEHHDCGWGWCTCEKCKNKTKHNKMGPILEQVRSEEMAKRRQKWENMQE